MIDKIDLEQRIATYRLSDPMIVLIGPMGAGKTTVGRKLAQNLHLDFVDTDQAIEQNAGCRITEIFEQEGEEGFRQREKQALETYCCLSGTVIATGGGAILAETNRRMMRNGIVIYLHATPVQQFQRIKKRTHRPNFNPDDGVDSLIRLMKVREPLYRGEADFTVNTGKQSIELIISAIEKFLVGL